MPAFDPDEVAGLLRAESALPELAPADAARLVPLMRLTFAAPDSVLFRAGAPDSPFMVLLAEGDAVVEGKLTVGGESIVLRTLTAGDLFGEMGAMESMGRTVTVRATSEVCLATLDDQAMQTISSDDHGLCFALLRAVLPHVTRRLRAANDKIRTLQEINQALRDEWADQVRADHAAGARLSVLMKMERNARRRA